MLQLSGPNCLGDTQYGRIIRRTGELWEFLGSSQDRDDHKASDASAGKPVDVGKVNKGIFCEAITEVKLAGGLPK